MDDHFEYYYAIFNLFTFYLQYTGIYILPSIYIHLCFANTTEF